MDAALNVAFFVVHTAWMLFNCAGWAWRRTRRLHLITVGLTAGSWFGLGAWYGWGYCPCTDWHWQVRERLGYVDPPSYTEMLFETLTGIEVASRTADIATVSLFALAAALSLWLNLHDRSMAVDAGEARVRRAVHR